MTIVSRLEGALELLGIEDLSPLTSIAAQKSLALEVLRFTWSIATATEAERVKENIDQTMPILLKVFEGTDAVTFINFSSAVLSIYYVDVSRVQSKGRSN